MFADLLDVDQVNRASLAFLIDGPVCGAQTDRSVPSPFSLQDVVSVSGMARAAARPPRLQVNPKRELLDDVPRYLRELFLGVSTIQRALTECTHPGEQSRPITDSRSFSLLRSDSDRIAQSS